MKMPCPRCEELGGQGAVYKARIPSLNIELNICDECEAFWMENQQINTKKITFLRQFLQENFMTYKDFCLLSENLGYLEE